MKNYRLIVVLAFFVFNITFSQTTTKSNPGLEQRFIEEVFGSNIAKDGQHYKNLQKLLRERVIFTQESLQENEKFPKISQSPLFNKYNSELIRDVDFNENNFNVLKYNLNFFSPNTMVYRFDNSDWLIIINP